MHTHCGADSAGTFDSDRPESEENMPDYSFTSIKAISMPADFSILLVYDQDEPVCGVERIFQLNGINLRRVRNCVEAREVLREAAAPCVVVTDLALPDGDWADVLRAANDATAKAAVIVASRTLDIKLYLDVLDSGAHDFVVPPFSASDLAHIIRTAIETGRSFLSQSLGSDKSPAGPDYFQSSEGSQTCAKTAWRAARTDGEHCRGGDTGCKSRGGAPA